MVLKNRITNKLTKVYNIFDEPETGGVLVLIYTEGKWQYENIENYEPVGETDDKNNN